MFVVQACRVVKERDRCTHKIRSSKNEPSHYVRSLQDASSCALHERELRFNRSTARQPAAADHSFSNNEFKPARIMNYLASFLLLLTSMLLRYVCKCMIIRCAFVLVGVGVLNACRVKLRTKNLSAKTVGHNRAVCSERAGAQHVAATATA
jgi:hypothetical protein